MGQCPNKSLKWQVTSSSLQLGEGPWTTRAPQGLRAGPVGYLGPLFRPDIKGVSDGPLQGVLHAPPDELSVNWLLHEHPGGGCTALALVEEQSLMGALHCQVHWREGGGGDNRKRLCR